jgi:hypothetical protein
MFACVLVYFRFYSRFAIVRIYRSLAGRTYRVSVFNVYPARIFWAMSGHYLLDDAAVVGLYWVKPGFSYRGGVFIVEVAVFLQLFWKRFFIENSCPQRHFIYGCSTKGGPSPRLSCVFGLSVSYLRFSDCGWRS